MTKPLVIAVDGPAASGKGTLAARLAVHFNLPHLDTGCLYRVVAKKTLHKLKYEHHRDALHEIATKLESEIAIEAAKSIIADDLTANDLSNEAIGQAASIISAIPTVRDALLAYQQQFAAQATGAVLDGRDIGTVICPDATIKLFIIAKTEVRAERRFKQQQAIDPGITYETILADISARDLRDIKRTHAPLKAAADAITIDTSAMNADEAFAKALEIINAA